MSYKITRRLFAQTSAAGMGLPRILPAGVLAGQSPNEKLSFACIGIGGQMRGYLIPELNKLDQKIDAIGENMSHESFPTCCTVTYDFAAKGKRGPVKLVFYSGENNLPPHEVTRGPVELAGCLIVGSEGTLSARLWNTDPLGC